MMFPLRSSSTRDPRRCSNSTNNICLVVALAITIFNAAVVHGFSLGSSSCNNGATVVKARTQTPLSTGLFMSSFSADGAEYSAKDSDYESDGVEERNWGDDEYKEEGDEDDVETVEQKPVPMSKNAGNRFVALYWDHELEQNKQEGEPRESWWLHYDRDDLNEDHVMFCRKNNLYNETFNEDSMVDVMRSLPM